MVVDAEVDERVGESRVATVALDDEQGGGLPAAAVAARRLRGVEAVEQSLGESLARRRLERLCERVDGRAGDEDVALRRVRAPRAPARPRVALVPGEGRRAPLAVDDPELAERPPVVGARSDVRRPPRRTARHRGARARPGRSAGSRTTGSRSRRRAAPPTARPSPRRGTSTASRRPTDRPRGRTRRWSRSRPAQPYVSSGRSSSSSFRSETSTQETSGRASARAHRRGVVRPCHDRLPERMREPQPVEVVHRVDEERVGDVDRPLERDRRHAPAGGAEPTLSHSTIVSPGPDTSSSTPAGSSGRNASGVPVRSGKVP